MGPKCNHMYPSKEIERRKADSQSRRYRSGGDVTMEDGTGRIQPQAKEHMELPGAGKGKEKIFSSRLQREHDLMTP